MEYSKEQLFDLVNQFADETGVKVDALNQVALFGFACWMQQKLQQTHVSGSLPPESRLVVAAQFCPKCSPNTWGNYKFQILPDVQVCGVCGHEHRYNTGGNDH